MKTRKKLIVCPKCGDPGELRKWGLKGKDGITRDCVIHEIIYRKAPFGVMPEIVRDCLIERI